MTQQTLIRIPLVLCLVLSVLFGIFSKRGWLDYQRMQNKNQELAQKLAEIESQKSQLESRIAALQSNPEAQENTVRRYLGYLKKNEISIEFP